MNINFNETRDTSFLWCLICLVLFWVKNPQRGTQPCRGANGNLWKNACTKAFFCWGKLDPGLDKIRTSQLSFIEAEEIDQILVNQIKEIVELGFGGRQSLSFSMD